MAYMQSPFTDFEVKFEVWFAPLIIGVILEGTAILLYLTQAASRGRDSGKWCG